jgi:hypothetical protein
MCKRLLFIGVFVLAMSSISLGFGGLGSWGSGYALQGAEGIGYQSPAGQGFLGGAYQATGQMGGYGGAFALQTGSVGLEQTVCSPNSIVPCLTDVYTQGACVTGFQFSTAIGYPCQPYSNCQVIGVMVCQGTPLGTLK